METLYDDQYMEKNNEDQGNMQNLEDVKEDTLMEQVQQPFTIDCEVEDQEVDFLLCEEEYYPSFFVIEDTNNLDKMSM